MAKKKSIKERIEKLLSLISEGVYEKEVELRLSLLAAIAGQSILLLGPPGVAKSMVARRLKYAFKDATAFEYLMSRFSTPDEIFGPVSIAKLKESDKYERTTEGYLPNADVVFLDEIWKAGPAIQNTLLTVINEKVFLNGDHQMKLPLKLLMGASNELPTQGEGLEALWDRFVIRYVSGCISKEKQFLKMILQTSATEPEISESEIQITDEEYHEWQEMIDKIRVPETVQQAILFIRKALSSVAIDGTDLKRNIYVSDRRWKNIVRLLRTSAFMHDRDEVSPSDLIVANFCLWNETDERTPVSRVVFDSLFKGYRSIIKSLQKEVDENIKQMHLREALEKSKENGGSQDDTLLIYDNFYYYVEGHSTGHTYIYIPDFRNMPLSKEMSIPVKGCMYIDEKKRTIIRVHKDTLRLEENDYNITTCTLYRDENHLYINGVRHLIAREKENAPQSNTFACITEDMYTQKPDKELESKVESLVQEILSFEESLKNHLFSTRDESSAFKEMLAATKKEIAYIRNDISNLLYGE